MCLTISSLNETWITRLAARWLPTVRRLLRQMLGKPCLSPDALPETPSVLRIFWQSLSPKRPLPFSCWLSQPPTNNNSLRVPVTISLRWRCQKGHVSFTASGEGSNLISSWWLPVFCSWWQLNASLYLYISCLFLCPKSPSLFSYKNTSHWV